MPQDAACNMPQCQTKARPSWKSRSKCTEWGKQCPPQNRISGMRRTPCEEPFLRACFGSPRGENWGFCLAIVYSGRIENQEKDSLCLSECGETPRRHDVLCRLWRMFGTCCTSQKDGRAPRGWPESHVLNQPIAPPALASGLELRWHTYLMLWQEWMAESTRNIHISTSM